MKRRDFMKSIVALPFIGPLIKKAFAVETKPSPAQNDDDLLNGTVWEDSKCRGHRVIVQFYDYRDGKAFYVLLSSPYKAANGGTAIMVCHLDSHDEWSGLYTEDQLRAKLSRWHRRPELELRLWNRETEELNWI